MADLQNPMTVATALLSQQDQRGLNYTGRQRRSAACLATFSELHENVHGRLNWTPGGAAAKGRA